MLKIPTAKTLAKYGLNLGQWLDMFYDQERACGICKKVPPSGRLVIDHEHRKGWSKMPPKERRKYVRGLLDWRCNYHFAGKGMNTDRAKNLLDYLQAYDKVKP